MEQAARGQRSHLSGGPQLLHAEAHRPHPRHSLQLAPDKLLEAQRAILEEIGKLADTTYITPQELSAAQRQLGIQALYEREQSTGWAHTVGFWWATAGLDYYRNYVPNMQRVTRQDIARYARTYLIGKPFVTGVLVSPDTRTKLSLTPETLLKNGGIQ